MSQCQNNGLVDPDSIRGHMPAVYPRDGHALVSMFREPYSRLYSEYKYINLTCSAIVTGSEPFEASGVIRAIGFDPYDFICCAVLRGAGVDICLSRSCT